jgi:hypothetical protein
MAEEIKMTTVGIKEETARQLRILAATNGELQYDIIERLIAKEFKKLQEVKS